MSLVLSGVLRHACMDNLITGLDRSIVCQCLARPSMRLKEAKKASQLCKLLLCMISPFNCFIYATVKSSFQ